MAAVFMARGFDVVSGGTDNHLMLVSLIPKGITGKAADAALGKAHITVNKNAVPNDPESPFVERAGSGACPRGAGEAVPWEFLVNSKEIQQCGSNYVLLRPSTRRKSLAGYK